MAEGRRRHPQSPLEHRLSRRALLAGTAASGLAAGLGASVGSPAYAASATARGLGVHGALLPPGSLPHPHLPAGTDTLPQIEHIVVLMMENHSFDDHLGTLGRGDGLTAGADGRPVNYNPDPSGGYVRSFHNPNTCGESDSGITQSWNASHTCWDGGTNMGFVKGCGGAAMGYWEGDDLPFYHSMARVFPIGDRYFSSVMAQTYPNRRFLIAGTALGEHQHGRHGHLQGRRAQRHHLRPPQRARHLLEGLLRRPSDLRALFEPVFLDNRTKAVHMTEFFADAASGSLPAFSLVDPYGNFSEEDGDITVGEGYAALFVNAVMSGPAWDKTALVWVYDEHGGWYDHVPPQPAVKPDDVPPMLTADDTPGSYDYTGFRVPCCVVSAWSKKDYVSHRTFDHTSILKLVETKWNLPALTYRDANANDMTDFFDLAATRPPFADPPTLAAPRNPFSSPAALPPGSITTAQQALFHTTCTDLPAGSLPPAEARLTVIPPHDEALLRAQQRRIRQEIRAQA